MDATHTIGDALRRARQDAGLPVERVAADAGMTVDTLRRIERTGNGRYANIAALARRLGVSLDGGGAGCEPGRQAQADPSLEQAERHLAALRAKALDAETLPQAGQGEAA